MNCPICQQECKSSENRYYSFSHFRIDCDNLDCPAVKKTGFRFLIDYKIHNYNLLSGTSIEIISLNFVFEHQGHWYLFSQNNKADSRGTYGGVYTLYFFSEERRRGQQWGTFSAVNEIPQNSLPIDPGNLVHDVMQYFNRVMKLKAFL